MRPPQSFSPGFDAAFSPPPINDVRAQPLNVREHEGCQLFDTGIQEKSTDLFAAPVKKPEPPPPLPPPPKIPTAICARDPRLKRRLPPPPPSSTDVVAPPAPLPPPLPTFDEEQFLTSILPEAVE